MPKPSRVYFCTLDDVITQLALVDAAAYNQTATTQTIIDADKANNNGYLTDLIADVSNAIVQTWERVFVPYVDTETIYANEPAWRWFLEGSTLIFNLDATEGYDLLAVDSITLNDSAIASSNYRLFPRRGEPATQVRFNDGTVDLPTNNDFDTSLVIDGTWGYHDNYAEAWRNSGQVVQDAPLTASATTLNVTDGGLFETLQYIRIEDEFCLITSITDEALTIERGVNGTTASEHANGTQIDTYQQVDSVRKAVRSMVIRCFNLRSETNNYIVTAQNIMEVVEGDAKLPIPKRVYLGRV